MAERRLSDEASEVDALNERLRDERLCTQCRQPIGPPGAAACHADPDTTPVHTGQCFRQYTHRKRLHGLLGHRSGVYYLIDCERKRQERKWGSQANAPNKEAVILMEEVGEVARALLDGTREDLHNELVQVAAVCCRWLETMHAVPNGAHITDDDGEVER